MQNNKNIIEVGLVSLVFFALTAIEVVAKFVIPFDNFIHTQIAKIFDPNFYQVMLLITNLGDSTMIAVLSIILILFFIKKNSYQSIVTLIVGLGCGVISGEILKLLFERPRPLPVELVELNWSFPSGHTLAATIFFGLLIYFFKNSIQNHIAQTLFISVSVLLIVLVGFSRLYLGVHFASDVIGSIFLGIFWIAIGIVSKPPKLLTKN